MEYYPKIWVAQSIETSQKAAQPISFSIPINVLPDPTPAAVEKFVYGVECDALYLHPGISSGGLAACVEREAERLNTYYREGLPFPNAFLCQGEAIPGFGTSTASLHRLAAKRGN